MLIKQSGKCEECVRDFGQFDTVQSTDVECNKCRNKKKLCSTCKEKGCECGGEFQNVFDKFPNLLH